MRRIGADVKFRDGASLFAPDPVGTLDVLEELGFRGILVRTMDEAFPTLDEREIAGFAAEAEARGFFVRMGVGKINPYMTAELPRVRRLGDGSYLAGMERMIRICARYGWTELWTATGGYKPGLPAPFCFDRFRTDVSWASQLEETGRFVEKLAPVLREHGCRLDIETHEEITTHEILRLIETHGDDVLGICLDPANLPVRGEPFAAGIRRAARRTRITHLRDAVLVPSEHGISRFLVPIGDGQIEWGETLDVLLTANPDVDLLVEAVGGTRAEMAITPDDEAWRAAHPDLDPAELAELDRLAEEQARRIEAGDAPDLDRLRRGGDARTEHLEFLARSLAALQHRLAA